MKNIQDVKDVLEKYNNQRTISQKDIGVLNSTFFLNGKEAIGALKSMTIADFYCIQRHVSYLISRIGYERSTFLLGLLNELYSCACLLQIKKDEYIHKGLILYMVGVLYYYLNEKEFAMRLITLSIIDDIIHKDAKWARTSHAFRFLAINFYDEIAAEHIITSLEKRIDKLGVKKDIYFPENVLNYDDHLEVIPGDTNNLFKINRTLYKVLYEDFINSTKSDDKNFMKNALEDLTKHLFSSVIGLQLISKNVKTASSELDVVYRIIKYVNPLYEMFGHYLIIECKNTKDNVDVKVIRDFVGKLQSLNVTGGIIVSRKGITKAKNKDKLNAELELSKAYHRHGITIVVLDNSDLKSICKGNNLISILIKNYEKTRFDIKY